MENPKLEDPKLEDPKLDAASQYPSDGYFSEVLSGADEGVYCLYNQTRKCFLGVEVEAADFSVSALEDRLPTLTPGCGVGLWLIPFRGISPLGVTVPFDLLYLDRNSVVIDAVESFPIFRVSPSVPLAASVLALPAHTISSTQTQPGDQLMIYPPDEMKRRLERLTSAALEGGALRGAPGSQPGVSSPDETNRGVSASVLQFEDRLGQKPSGQDVPAEEAVPHQVPFVKAAPEPQAESSAMWAVKPRKSWLERWLSFDPTEPSRSLREPIPDLIAHFFTGGGPQEHPIRDISLTGLYVLTNERWYPGTVVRMTLTDRREPTVERSITVNATVVRWGNDGLGLRFVLQNPKARHPELDGVLQGVDQKQLEQFLQRLKGVAE